MPTKKKKKGTASSVAKKQEGYAAVVPAQAGGAEPQVASTAATMGGAGADEASEDVPPPLPERPASATKITVDGFDAHVRSLREDGQVAALFHKVQMESVENPGTFEHANDPDNKTKNRDTNVHPYDHSRVPLAYPEGTGTGDYINANYVDGYSKSKEYICCQGPLPNTVQDFWWLVWQEKIETIAMLNKLEENGRKKCEKYWPEVDESTEHGPVTVTGLPASEPPATDVVKRTFSVAVDGAEPRVVTQYQFTGWPDFGIPNTADGVLDICRIVETAQTAAPTIVHCSAGIGRTGTYCTVDIGRKMIQAEQSVDVLGILKKLRLQRPGMVQAKEQLDFCYQALLEHIEMTKFMNNGNDYSESD
jgi:protein tyrosine phosphatase